MGQKHSEYLSGLLGKENIFVLTKQENIPFASLNSISQINKSQIATGSYCLKFVMVGWVNRKTML